MYRAAFLQGPMLKLVRVPKPGKCGVAGCCNTCQAAASGRLLASWMAEAMMLVGVLTQKAWTLWLSFAFVKPTL